MPEDRMGKPVSEAEPEKDVQSEPEKDGWSGEQEEALDGPDEWHKG